MEIPDTVEIRNACPNQQTKKQLQMVSIHHIACMLVCSCIPLSPYFPQEWVLGSHIDICNIQNKNADLIW